MLQFCCQTCCNYVAILLQMLLQSVGFLLQFCSKGCCDSGVGSRWQPLKPAEWLGAAGSRWGRLEPLGAGREPLGATETAGAAGPLNINFYTVGPIRFPG